MLAMNGGTITRIAPTPSGLLHRGNAYNFLLTEFLAGPDRSLQLRIDDLDAERVRQEYLQDIFDTLRWLGIRPDRGPRSVTEQEEIYSQQLRLPRYQALLEKLAADGHVFACTCSRKDIAASSEDGQYPGTCRFKNIPLDHPDAAWRLYILPGTVIQFRDVLLGDVSIDLSRQARDFVVRRRDGVPAYHIASLADDLHSGINLVVRGRDLLESTAVQLHLSDLLQAPAFRLARFCHHPLLSTPGGEKLSKSAGSTAVKTIRESGLSSVTFREAFREWLDGFYRGI